MSYHFRHHYQFWPQVFGQHQTQVINHQICHHLNLMRFCIVHAFQHIIQVKFYLWLPVQVQIFLQRGTKVSNYHIHYHFILMIFWPMFLLYIQLNIQNWSQVLSHSFHSSEIPNCVLSGGYFTHTKILQTKTQKHLTISYSSNLSCWFYVLNIYKTGRYWTKSMVSVRAYPVTSLPNSGSVPSSWSSMQLNFKLKPDNQKYWETHN